MALDAQPFSIFVFKATLYLFLFGMLFALGQTPILGFEFMNSFGYVEYVQNSVMAVPYLFIILFFGAGLIILVVLPSKMALDLVRAIRIKKADNTDKKLLVTNALVVFIAWISAISGLVLYAESKRFISFIVLAILFALTLLKFFVIEPKIRKSNIDYDSKDIVNDSFFKFFDLLVNSKAFLLYLVIAPILGFYYLHFQILGAPNATLTFEDIGEQVDVRILTSNSKNLIFLNDSRIEMVQRDKILKVRYINKKHAKLPE